MGKYFQSPVKIYLDSCVINIQKIVEKVPFENIVIQLITPSKQKYFADPKKEEGKVLEKETMPKETSKLKKINTNGLHKLHRRAESFLLYFLDLYRCDCETLGTDWQLQSKASVSLVVCL